MRTAKGLAALASGDLLGKIATLTFVVIAARALGPTDYGVFAFALALGTLAAIIPSWGFDLVVIQEGSAEPKRLPALLAQLLVARTAAVMLVAVPVIGIELFRRGGAAGIASALVLAACFLDTYSDAYRAVAAACDAQARSAAALVAQRVFTALAIVAVIYSGFGLVAVAASFLTGSAVGLVTMIFIIARLKVRAPLRQVRFREVRSFIGRSHVVGISGVISALLFRIDSVLLGLLAGDAAVGEYSAAYRLLETVLFIAWATSKAIFPVVAKNPEPWRIRRGFERGLAILSAAFLPYAAVLLLRGADLLNLLYGQAYAVSGSVILHWLAVAPLLFGIGYLANYSLISPGPDKRVLIGSILALIVNVALNITLIPILAGVGAAIATTLSYAVEAIILTMFLARSFGPVFRLRALAPAVTGTAVVTGVLAAPLPIVPALVVAATTYIISWLIVARALDPEQLAVIRGLIRVTRGTSRHKADTAQ